MSESLHQLNRDWERLRLKYGIAASPPEMERLLLTSRRKGARLRDMRARLAVIQAEADALEGEVAGIDKAIRYFLSEIVARVEIERGPAWSPVPMLGFRVWTLKDGEFRGYRVRWEHRSMTAWCGTTDNNEDVPHTDGQCADPPCGVYAAKDVDQIIDAHADPDINALAVGLVAMTGKVVEHEHGWRAEQATVVALSFVRAGRVRSTDDPEEIELLFQGVGLSAGWSEAATAPPGRDAILAAMIGYMKRQERKKTVWISESPSGL